MSTSWLSAALFSTGLLWALAAALGPGLFSLPRNAGVRETAAGSWLRTGVAAFAVGSGGAGLGLGGTHSARAVPLAFAAGLVTSLLVVTLSRWLSER